MINKKRFHAIVRKIQSKQTEKTIVFAYSVKYANAISAYLSACGIDNGLVTNTTAEHVRADILNRFSTGKLNIVVNKSILATGYDVPAIKNVIISHPVKSSILYEQILGRGSRGPKVGGDEFSSIFELDENFEYHGDPISYMRFKNRYLVN